MSAIEKIRTVIDQMLRPLRARVYMMISRAIIESVNDSDGMQVVKLNLLAGETRTDIERFQNFGFSSNPPDNAECVAVAIGGNRDHLIVVVADDRASRPTGILKGESIMFNANGNKLHMKMDGTLEGAIDKLKLQNDTADLVAELARMSEALAAEPFIVNKATFIDIQLKLESFKV